MIAKIDKASYIQFCHAQDDLPVFNSPQWLDSVSDDWDAVVINDGEGIVKAGLPYNMKTRYFFKAISMPMLTPSLDILISHDMTHEEEKITTLIIDALPHCHYQSIILNPKHKNHLPWKWKKYDISTRYTFQSANVITYNDNIKSDIRYADKLLNIEEYEIIEEHFNMVVKTFEGQNLMPPISLNQLKKIYHQNIKNIKLIRCVDEDQRTQASLLGIYDNGYFYNLSSGRRQDAVRGAVTLITDHAIKWSTTNNKVFDFEGSSLPSVYKFYAQFGGDLVPQLRVTKSSNMVIKFFMALTSRI